VLLFTNSVKVLLLGGSNTLLLSANSKEYLSHNSPKKVLSFGHSNNQ